MDTVNKRGTTLDLYTCDGWNNSATSYVAIPLFTTTRGAGIYINRYERIIADFGDNMANVWEIKLENEILVHQFEINLGFIKIRVFFKYYEFILKNMFIL